MAFLTLKTIANSGVANFHNKIVLGHTVSRDFEGEFMGGKGDTVTARIPAKFVAEDFVRANGITVQAVNETSLDVKVDKFPNVSAGVTDEQMTLDIKDFDTQVLTPMMEALGEKVDAYIAALLVNVSQETTGDITDPKVLAEASGILGTHNVPRSDRFAVISPVRQADWSTKPPFLNADQSASTSALRDAILGKAFSFETLESNADLGAGVEGVAYHKTAFTLVTRVPVIPKGVTGAVANYDGFGVRFTYGYDISRKETVLSADFLCGVKAVAPDHAVLLPSV